MKKRITAISLIFAVIAVLTLAGCKDASVYVDPAGNTHIAVTDENHNTILNNEGNIVIYATDDDGKIVTDTSGVPQTLASIFPELIENGDIIQTPTYSIKLPGGWVPIEGKTGYFEKKSLNARVEVEIITKKTLDAYYIYAKGILDHLEKLLGDESELTYTEDKFTYLAANTEAYRFEVTQVSEGVHSKFLIIIFENGGNVYNLRCFALADSFDKVDFAEFYSAIHYKNFKYHEDTTADK